MRIAHVVDSMEVGGAEVLVSQMCHLQRERGHEVAIYAVAGLGELGARMQAAGFTVQANMGRHLTDGSRAFFRAFRSSKPDVAHLHNPTPSIYAALPARMAGVRKIVSTRHSLVAPPRRLLVEAKYMLTAQCCNWIVGVCDATVANIASMHTVPKRKIVRVYNGTLPVIRVASDRMLPKEGFTLLFVGRLAAVKNLQLLLRAFALGLARNAQLRLWIAGDGPERARLEQLGSELGISAHVKFWGQQLEVAPFYSSADAFIMSSRSEGLPMSLLQAFSAGLPAIVPDVGGMGEVVRIAKAGYTTRADDSDEMSDAIVRMASNAAEREAFSAEGQAAFRSMFSIENTVDAYFNLYESAGY